MAKRKLAIIGGGPKAAAISAKASVLRSINGVDIQVTVFERSDLGAAWDGKHGFTDGDQRVCTPAERDIGFPYQTHTFGRAVAVAMLSRFSWAAYAARTNQYDVWVDGGRRRLPHRLFAEYVSDCIRKSEAQVVLGEVRALTPRDGKWRVGCHQPGGRSSDASAAELVDFDAVVVTGTGPAKKGFVRPEDDARVLDGVSFWGSAHALPLPPDASEPIVIVGAGGTAAAVAAKLARTVRGYPIVIIGRRPALHARVDSYFENRMFTDPETWAMLSVDDRKLFHSRLTSGAVWSNVLDDLAGENISYICGKVVRVERDPADESLGELIVHYETGAAEGVINLHPASMVIDATGFDERWFAGLLPADLGRGVRDDKNLEINMGESLRLVLPNIPPLHAPMLSKHVSPGCISLMTLGILSDQVLKPYVLELT